MDTDKSSVERTILELIKSDFIIKRDTPQGLDSLYRTTSDELSAFEMQNLDNANSSDVRIFSKLAAELLREMLLKMLMKIVLKLPKTWRLLLTITQSQ